MSAPDLVLRSTRVVTPAGAAAAAVHVKDGKISAVAAHGDVPAGAALVDAGDAVVFPGLVDTHVHLNEPGRTEWEGFSTATRAAAAGGITTLVDMPLNSIPPTTTLANLRAKLDAAQGQCAVDFGLWGGAIPGNTAELGPMLAAGVLGFKCFMVESGVDEFPCVDEAALREAMQELARQGGLLLAHAELPGPIAAAERAQAALPPAERRRYANYLASRPRAAEDQAIALLVALSRAYGTRVHVVHLSSADALPLLRAAKAEGLPVSAETCLHYLHYAAEDIPDGATEFKCAPPIRERENREQLWDALAEGLIEVVVSDHSPCTPALKRKDEGDFAGAWGGISSLQLGLSIMCSEVLRRGHDLERLAEWMSAAPARLAGLADRKGAIAVGRDADLVVWDPRAGLVVEPAGIHHRHRLTPYAGEHLRGVVTTTFLRGRRAYDRGEFAAAPLGRWLPRNPERTA
jgi:allantoinase